MFNKVSSSANDYVADGVKLFLVLDFDGVFNVDVFNATFKKEFYNPTNRENHPNPLYRKFDENGVLLRGKHKEPKSYRFVWSNDLVNDFNTLISRKDVQVLWLTTWHKHMDDVSVRLGFDYGRDPVYLPWGPDGGNYIDYDHSEKLPAFLDFFANFDNDSNVGIVWADDDVLSVNRSSRTKVDSKTSSLNNLLLVGPTPLYGVSRSEFNDVKNFSKKFVNVD